MHYKNTLSMAMHLPKETTVYRFLLRSMQVFGLLPLVFSRSKNGRKIKMKFSKPLWDTSVIYVICVAFLYLMKFHI